MTDDEHKGEARPWKDAAAGGGPARTAAGGESGAGDAMPEAPDGAGAATGPDAGAAPPARAAREGGRRPGGWTAALAALAAVLFPALVLGVALRLVPGEAILGFLGFDAAGAEARIAAQEARIAAQEGEIARLGEELAAARADGAGRAAAIEALRAPDPDLAALGEAVEELRAAGAGASEALDGLRAALAETERRVGALEALPPPAPAGAADGGFEARAASALAALGARVAELEAAQAGIARLVDADIRPRLDALEAASRAGTAGSGPQADGAAAARLAVSGIGAALEGGRGFARELAALREVAGIEAPAALASVAEGGAATMGGLRARFPDAARAALAAAPRGAEGGGAFGAAVLRLLGARSLEPREGASADAVLSRAEARLGGGNLDAALRELEDLPGEARGAMEGWIADAEALRAARAAHRELAARLGGP